MKVKALVGSEPHTNGRGSREPPMATCGLGSLGPHYVQQASITAHPKPPRGTGEVSATQVHPPTHSAQDVPRTEEKDEERNRDSKLQPPPGADQVCHSGQDELTQGEGEPQQDPRHGPALGGHPLHNCRETTRGSADSSLRWLIHPLPR